MEITLAARSRPLRGKGPARRARAQGLVPGILYGPALDPVPLAVEAKAMQQALHTEAGTNVMVNLSVDGKQFLAMPREVHRHPVRGTLLHVDFVNIARDVEITASVPVHLVGEAHGVRMGGRIEHHLFELSISALPSKIPSAIEADVSDLDIGQQLRVADLPIPEGVEVLSPADEIVVMVNEPTVAPAAGEGAEAGAAETPAEAEPAE